MAVLKNHSKLRALLFLTTIMGVFPYIFHSDSNTFRVHKRYFIFIVIHTILLVIRHYDKFATVAQFNTETIVYFISMYIFNFVATVFVWLVATSIKQNAKFYSQIYCKMYSQNSISVASYCTVCVFSIWVIVSRFAFIFSSNRALSFSVSIWLYTIQFGHLVLFTIGVCIARQYCSQIYSRIHQQMNSFQIRQIRIDIHKWLNEMHDVNYHFGFPMMLYLMLCVSYLLQIVHTCYNYFVKQTLKSSSVPLGFIFVSSAEAIITIPYLVLECNLLYKMKSKYLTTLFCLNTNKLNTEDRAQLTKLTQEIVDGEFKFNLCQCLKIDLELMLTLIGLVLSYVVLVSQDLIISVH